MTTGMHDHLSGGMRFGRTATDLLVPHADFIGPWLAGASDVRLNVNPLCLGKDERQGIMIKMERSNHLCGHVHDNVEGENKWSEEQDFGI